MARAWGQPCAARWLASLCFYATVFSPKMVDGEQSGLREASSVALAPNAEVVTAKAAVQAVQTKALESIDAAFAETFSNDEFDQDEIEAPMSNEKNQPFEEGKGSGCDPNAPPDPAAFGGQKSIFEVDLPDPGCSKLDSCYMCMQNRKCGWCAQGKVCKPTRSESPECANNLNTDVCSPPCEDMWHLNWPDGHIHVVSKFCNAIANEYETHAEAKGEYAMHFADN